MGDLVLSAELDMATGPVLEAAFAAHVPAAGRVELDLAGHRFIDSSGIRCLIRIAKSAGRAIPLRRPTEQVRGILSIAPPGSAATRVWQIA